MDRRNFLKFAVAGGCVPILLGADTSPKEQSRGATTIRPSKLTRYDIATQRESFYRRLVTPTIAGNSVENWTIFKGLADQVGNWVTPYIDAAQISTTISTAFPIGNQKAIQSISTLVGDCAAVLGLKTPSVFLRHSPNAIAYAQILNGEILLTVNSELLSLYERQPDELRFIIGRELGRVKCQHSSIRTKAYAILSAIQSINLALVPNEFQVALPTLALGWLMSAFREMEFSADRAGLLCCQSLDVAYQAMLRQLHGLRADSTWVDPNNPDFDAQEYLKTVEYWENRPFVKLVQKVKEYSSEVPFVPERIAELKIWGTNGPYQEILSRTSPNVGPDIDQIATIDSVTIFNIADDDSANPYVIAFTEKEEIFTSAVASRRRNCHWVNIAETRNIVDNQPIYFEIWNSNWGRDSFIGGFVVYPRNPAPRSANPKEHLCLAPISWDWKGRVATTRQGNAQVNIKFSSRAKG